MRAEDVMTADRFVQFCDDDEWRGKR